MAGELIQGMTEKWQPARYADKFSDAIKELLARKVKAGKTEKVEPLEEAFPEGLEGSNVIDLAELLKKSLGKRGAGRQADKEKQAKPAARRAPARKAARKARLTRRRSNVPASRHGAIECPQRPARTLRRQARLRGHFRAAGARAARKELSFVIQKHAATRLHYDFRLELDGTLKCWAVPKGPSLDPAESAWPCTSRTIRSPTAASRARFPPKQYGAGTVIVWDRGTWEPVGDPREGLAQGKLIFELHGEKLDGLWELVRIAKAAARSRNTGCCSRSATTWARPSRVRRHRRAARQRRSRSRCGLRRAARSPARRRRLRAASGDRRRRRRRAAGAVRPPLPDTGAAARHPRRRRRRPAATGSTRSSSTATACWRASRTARCGCSRATATTGPRKLPGLSPRSSAGPAVGWLDGEIVVLDGTARRTSTRCRTPSTARGTADSSTSCSTCPSSTARTCARCRWRRAGALLEALLDAQGDRDRVRFSDDFDGRRAQRCCSRPAAGLEGIIAKRARRALRVAPHARPGSSSSASSARSSWSAATPTAGTARPRSAACCWASTTTTASCATSATSAPAGTRDGPRAAAQLVEARGRRSPFEPAPGSPAAGRRARRAANTGSSRELVAEVTSREWTPDGQIRHASFQGLRTDKPAKRDRARDGQHARPDRAGAESRQRDARPAAGIEGDATRERVIDPSTGLTKLDLVRYYEIVADWMLPHLKGRPCSLVRGPTGVDGQLFFQKHDEKLSMPGMKRARPLAVARARRAARGGDRAGAGRRRADERRSSSTPGTRPRGNIDKPDRMIFDLDPGEGVAWPTRAGGGAC